MKNLIYRFTVTPLLLGHSTFMNMKADCPFISEAYVRSSLGSHGLLSLFSLPSEWGSPVPHCMPHNATGSLPTTAVPQPKQHVSIQESLAINLTL